MKSASKIDLLKFIKINFIFLLNTLIVKKLGFILKVRKIKNSQKTRALLGHAHKSLRLRGDFKCIEGTALSANNFVGIFGINSWFE